MSMRLNIKKAIVMAGIATMAVTGTIYAAETNEPATLDAEEVEYDMRTGQASARGNVVMTKGNATVTGDYAEYNSNTQEGKFSGNVVATKDDMRVTAELVTTDGKDHLVAQGAVNGIKADTHFIGPRVEYFQQDEYVLIPSGGSITSADGTFKADLIRGFMKEDHFVGSGNAHMVSPKNNMEAGGDQVDYWGKEQGKAVITGNAWAVQDNNTMKSKKLTVYLADDGKASVK
ncbi:OstA family protein [Anaerovibrio sp. JC8]|uniref:LptA/OstA family protein n=1 Tax=Anaerovibrio sp. JC8 TaxID=1240085 RepID=UPI000A0CE3D7|nr:LptA/OstA family protein [Anaerovibrio sp. JC8]ORU00936.1 OstA family protein [Anaerovibrio sp. JC8]